MLYAEWRKPWESKTREYARLRALTFLRLAIPCSSAMTAVSLKKHKSWYYHLLVWVVPLQMAYRGDGWAYSTSPVEQRGARLKRIVRSCVSWRPFCDGWVQAHGPRQRDEGELLTFVPRRKYESCAMMQCLRACVAQEEMWDVDKPDDVLSATQRRLKNTGRSSVIKQERVAGPRLLHLVEEIIDLTRD